VAAESSTRTAQYTSIGRDLEADLEASPARAASAAPDRFLGVASRDAGHRRVRLECCRVDRRSCP
jgi:hypothetical protein